MFFLLANLELPRLQFSLPRPAGQCGHLLADGGHALCVRVEHDGRDQARLRADRNGDVDTVVLPNESVHEGGVGLWHAQASQRASLDDEVVDGQLQRLFPFLLGLRLQQRVQLLANAEILLFFRSNCAPIKLLTQSICRCAARK
jgi:hypothetical protein